MCGKNNSNPMKNLLNEYRESLIITRRQLRNLEKKIMPLKQIYDNPDATVQEREIAREEAEPFIIDKSIIAGWESNILYCIQWMETGKCPSNIRGIERRAAYEREIPFGNQWIQKQKDKSDVQSIDILLEDEENSESFIEDEMLKRELTSKIMSTLTIRQKEIIELIAAGYSQEEVGEMMGISQQAVSKAIARSKEKISDAGWFMI